MSPRRGTLAGRIAYARAGGRMQRRRHARERDEASHVAREEITVFFSSHQIAEVVDVEARAGLIATDVDRHAALEIGQREGRFAIAAVECPEQREQCQREEFAGGEGLVAMQPDAAALEKESNSPTSASIFSSSVCRVMSLITCTPLFWPRRWTRSVA